MPPSPLKRRASTIGGVGRTQIQEGVWSPSIHPLAEATAPEDLERYPWPDMNDPQRVAHVHEQAQRLANEGRYAILGVPWLLFPFERAIALQGMEKFLVNMVRHPDFAQALLLKVADLCRTLMGHFLEAIGENIDIIKIGDDLGGQNGLLISPALYRRMLKPIHADYIAFIKQRTRAKVFFHSDGDIFDLLDDLVEIGVDILNPLQTTAGKMANLAELKRRYGKNLVFCGGIDTQRLLPFGSPQRSAPGGAPGDRALGPRRGIPPRRCPHHPGRHTPRKHPGHGRGSPGVRPLPLKNMAAFPGRHVLTPSKILT